MRLSSSNLPVLFRHVSCQETIKFRGEVVSCKNMVEINGRLTRGNLFAAVPKYHTTKDWHMFGIDMSNPMALDFERKRDGHLVFTFPDIPPCGVRC